MRICYICFLYLSVECDFLRWTHEEIVRHTHKHGRGVAMEVIWVFAPTVYSLILLGKSEKVCQNIQKRIQEGLGNYWH